ncbi:hypothetical protein [Alistipes sp.]|jgi:hypothetical protein|uniref:hypothetical protein n=1 Tax=Alistipes sp. TaxID=1872444 RepID=UPI0011CAAD1F
MKKILILISCIFCCTSIQAQQTLYELWLAARTDVEGKQFHCCVKNRKGKYKIEINKWRTDESQELHNGDYKIIIEALVDKGFRYNLQNDTLLFVFKHAVPDLKNIFDISAYSRESYLKYEYDGYNKELFTSKYTEASIREKYAESLVYTGDIEAMIEETLRRGIIFDTPYSRAYRIIIHDGQIQFPTTLWIYDGD